MATIIRHGKSSTSSSWRNARREAETIDDILKSLNTKLQKELQNKQQHHNADQSSIKEILKRAEATVKEEEKLVLELEKRIQRYNKKLGKYAVPRDNPEQGADIQDEEKNPIVKAINDAKRREQKIKGLVQQYRLLRAEYKDQNVRNQANVSVVTELDEAEEEDKTSRDTHNTHESSSSTKPQRQIKQINYSSPTVHLFNRVAAANAEIESGVHYNYLNIAHNGFGELPPFFLRTPQEEQTARHTHKRKEFPDSASSVHNSRELSSSKVNKRVDRIEKSRRTRLPSYFLQNKGFSSSRYQEKMATPNSSSNSYSEEETARNSHMASDDEYDASGYESQDDFGNKRHYPSPVAMGHSSSSPIYNGDSAIFTPPPGSKRPAKGSERPSQRKGLTSSPHHSLLIMTKDNQYSDEDCYRTSPAFVLEDEDDGWETISESEEHTKARIAPVRHGHHTGQGYIRNTEQQLLAAERQFLWQEIRRLEAIREMRDEAQKAEERHNNELQRLRESQTQQRLALEKNQRREVARLEQQIRNAETAILAQERQHIEAIRELEDRERQELLQIQRRHDNAINNLQRLQQDQIGALQLRQTHEVNQLRGQFADALDIKQRQYKNLLDSERTANQRIQQNQDRQIQRQQQELDNSYNRQLTTEQNLYATQVKVQQVQERSANEILQERLKSQKLQSDFDSLQQRTAQIQKDTEQKLKETSKAAQIIQERLEKQTKEQEKKIAELSKPLQPAKIQSNHGEDKSGVLSEDTKKYLAITAGTTAVSAATMGILISTAVLSAATGIGLIFAPLIVTMLCVTTSKAYSGNERTWVDRTKQNDVGQQAIAAA